MNALIPCWRPFGTIQRMPRMTSCSRGDVVLVKFVFADEKGAKQRPGLIVSIDRYHQGRREMILAAITSNGGRLLVGDYKIKGWRESGLPGPSIDTCIVRTYTQVVIGGTRGAHRAQERNQCDDKR